MVLFPPLYSRNIGSQYLGFCLLFHHSIELGGYQNTPRGRRASPVGAPDPDLTVFLPIVCLYDRYHAILQHTQLVCTSIALVHGRGSEYTTNRQSLLSFRYLFLVIEQNYLSWGERLREASVYIRHDELTCDTVASTVFCVSSPISSSGTNSSPLE